MNIPCILTIAWQNYLFYASEADRPSTADAGCSQRESSLGRWPWPWLKIGVQCVQGQG